MVMSTVRARSSIMIRPVQMLPLSYVAPPRYPQNTCQEMTCLQMTMSWRVSMPIAQTQSLCIRRALPVALTCGQCVPCVLPGCSFTSLRFVANIKWDHPMLQRIPVMTATPREHVLHQADGRPITNSKQDCGITGPKQRGEGTTCHSPTLPRTAAQAQHATHHATRLQLIDRDASVQGGTSLRDPRHSHLGAAPG